MRRIDHIALYLLILVLSVPAKNWKQARKTHVPVEIRTKDLKQFSQNLANEQNFRSNLDAILIPRPVGSSNHDKVRQYITKTMRASGWNVEQDRFRDQTPLGQRQFTNIIATHDPRAARRLVIACHYDSKITPRGFVAATDSAVPCAMMLNMAQTMKKYLEKKKQKKSNLTLQFIFFDGEEAFRTWSSTDSLYGSRHLAAKWQREGGLSGNQNDRIDLFVLLDLLGSGDMQILRQEGSTARWFDRVVGIEVTLRRQNMIQGPSIFKNIAGSSIEDDHIPFKNRGVPILHLISNPFPRVWHKLTDNINALNFKKIADFNKILRIFVAEYLNGRQRIRHGSGNLLINLASAFQ